MSPTQTPTSASHGSFPLQIRLNNKIRLIIRRAYGFHSAKAAAAMVMLCCGPVDLLLPHEK